MDYQNPLELNQYVYAAANPVMWSDPSGYQSTEFALNVRIAIKNAIFLSPLAYQINSLYTQAIVWLSTVMSTPDAQYLIEKLVELGYGGAFEKALDDIAKSQEQARAQIESQAQTKAQDLSQNTGGNWTFVGYHGTSSNFVPSILAQINPPHTKNSDFLQLGYGFYVMPWQDPRGLATADYFSRVAVRVHGGSRAILLIFALDFDKMSKTQVPSQHWSEPNIDRYPDHLYSQYDYLTAPFNDPAAPGNTQIKFNPHVFSRLVALPID